MWATGIAFKAPKQNNIKQWRKVEALIRNGVVFYENHYGPTPQSLREVAQFVARVTPKSEGQRFLDRIPRRRKKSLVKK